MGRYVHNLLNATTTKENSKTTEGKAKQGELLKVIENAQEQRMRSGEPR